MKDNINKGVKNWLKLVKSCSGIEQDKEFIYFYSIYKYRRKDLREVLLCDHLAFDSKELLTDVLHNPISSIINNINTKGETFFFDTLYHHYFLYDKFSKSNKNIPNIEIDNFWYPYLNFDTMKVNIDLNDKKILSNIYKYRVAKSDLYKAYDLIYGKNIQLVTNWSINDSLNLDIKVNVDFYQKLKIIYLYLEDNYKSYDIYIRFARIENILPDNLLSPNFNIYLKDIIEKHKNNCINDSTFKKIKNKFKYN